MNLLDSQEQVEIGWDCKRSNWECFSGMLGSNKDTRDTFSKHPQQEKLPYCSPCIFRKSNFDKSLHQGRGKPKSSKIISIFRKSAFDKRSYHEKSGIFGGTFFFFFLLLWASNHDLSCPSSSEAKNASK